jgi:hypothetical protein
MFGALQRRSRDRIAVPSGCARIRRPAIAEPGTDPAAHTVSAPSLLATFAPAFRSGGGPHPDLRFATPVGAPRAVGLIEQSRSTRPAGPQPAGVTTKGEAI